MPTIKDSTDDKKNSLDIFIVSDNKLPDELEDELLDLNNLYSSSLDSFIVSDNELEDELEDELLDSLLDDESDYKNSTESEDSEGSGSSIRVIKSTRLPIQLFLKKELQGKVNLVAKKEERAVKRRQDFITFKRQSVAMEKILLTATETKAQVEYIKNITDRLLGFNEIIGNLYQVNKNNKFVKYGYRFAVEAQELFNQLTTKIFKLKQMVEDLPKEEEKDYATTIKALKRPFVKLIDKRQLNYLAKKLDLLRKNKEKIDEERKIFNEQKKMLKLEIEEKHLLLMDEKKKAKKHGQIVVQKPKKRKLVSDQVIENKRNNLQLMKLEFENLDFEAESIEMQEGYLYPIVKLPKKKSKKAKKSRSTSKSSLKIIKKKRSKPLKKISNSN